MIRNVGIGELWGNGENWKQLEDESLAQSNDIVWDGSISGEMGTKRQQRAKGDCEVSERVRGRLYGQRRRLEERHTVKRV